MTKIVKNQRRTINRRKLDLDETLKVFETRIRSMDTDTLKKILLGGDVWLSTYDVWDTYTEIPTGPVAKNNAFIILKIARELGINILGVTTEHKSKNMVIPRPQDGKDVIYVGKLNTFNSKTAHEFLSVLVPDKRYEETPDQQ